MSRSRTAWRTTLVLGVLAAAAAGCGGDDAPASGPALSEGAGEALPVELVGAWRLHPKTASTESRLTLLAPDHPVCREMVGTRGHCYVAETEKGGGALAQDDLGQPRLEGYGEVGVRDGKLVFRSVLNLLERCQGGESFTTEYELSPDEEDLVLRTAAAPCEGAPPPTEETLERIGT